MSDGQCPVCQSAAKIERAGALHNLTTVICPGCGEYELPRTVVAMLEPGWPEGDGQLVVRHWLRTGQDAPELPRLTSDQLNSLLAHPRLPDAAEQLELAVRWLAREARYTGERVVFPDRLRNAVLGTTSAGGEFIMSELVDSGLADWQSSDEGPAYRLTIDGWSWFRELERHGRTDSSVIFMAMPFGNVLVERAYEECFAPAARRAGFDLKRLDDPPKAGLIDARLEVEIINAAMVITDLTDRNPGAYWEAGFAEGRGKDVIYTCEETSLKEEPTHFDTNHRYTLRWNSENFSEAEDKLTAAIRATLPDKAKMRDD